MKKSKQEQRVIVSLLASLGNCMPGMTVLSCSFKRLCRKGLAQVSFCLPGATCEVDT